MVFIPYHDLKPKRRVKFVLFSAACWNFTANQRLNFCLSGLVQCKIDLRTNVFASISRRTSPGWCISLWLILEWISWWLIVGGLLRVDVFPCDWFGKIFSTPGLFLEPGTIRYAQTLHFSKHPIQKFLKRLKL